MAWQESCHMKPLSLWLQYSVRAWDQGWLHFLCPLLRRNTSNTHRDRTAAPWGPYHASPRATRRGALMEGQWAGPALSSPHSPRGLRWAVSRTKLPGQVKLHLANAHFWAKQGWACGKNNTKANTKLNFQCLAQEGIRLLPLDSVTSVADLRTRFAILVTCSPRPRSPWREACWDPGLQIHGEPAFSNFVHNKYTLCL